VLIREGVAPATACQVAVAQPITDDAEMQRAIRELVSTIF
jgi:nitric oxide reductase NorQ protein